MPDTAHIFPRFTSLPPELRNQIWTYALPREDPPSMFAYRKGCLIPHYITKPDQNVGARLRYYYKLDREKLGPVIVAVPLVYVSREARAIALHWAQEHGIELRRHGQRYVLERQFRTGERADDSMQDTLYISEASWNGFRAERFRQVYDPRVKIPHWTVPYTRVAVPEMMLRRAVRRWLARSFKLFENTGTLYIVVGSQPDLKSEEKDGKVQQRRRLEKVDDGTFIWNLYEERFFPDPKTKQHIGKPFCEMLEKLRIGLIGRFVRRLEIQAVRAIG